MFLVFQMDQGQPDSDVHKRHELDKKIDEMRDIDSVFQISNLRVKKLHCTCLRTMKQ